jgi:pimeloyl-ACP methyl ester carboxylesterase
VAVTVETITLRRDALSFPALAAGDGAPVLLLHGFPDSPDTWEAQLPALAAAGFRAVAPTMRGYAPEAQPADGDYHAVRTAEDIVAWAEALGGRVHLIGHDWGASVAFAAAALAPERFASLAVIAVPHPARFAEKMMADPGQLARSDYMLAFQSPDAEAMISADDFAYLEALWRRWSPGWDVPAAALAAMRQTFAQPGVPTATLNWYRQAFDATSAAGQATAALLAKPVALPTLGICGADDGCISAEIFNAAMRPEDFPAGVSIHTLTGAGHFVHREAANAVNGLLIDWLRTRA